MKSPRKKRKSPRNSKSKSRRKSPRKKCKSPRNSKSKSRRKSPVPLLQELLPQGMADKVHPQLRQSAMIKYNKKWKNRRKAMRN